MYYKWEGEKHTKRTGVKHKQLLYVKMQWTNFSFGATSDWLKGMLFAEDD